MALSRERAGDSAAPPTLLGLLGLDSDQPAPVTTADIRAAYRKLCLEYHPDKVATRGRDDPVAAAAAAARFGECGVPCPLPALALTY